MMRIFGHTHTHTLVESNICMPCHIVSATIHSDSAPVGLEGNYGICHCWYRSDDTYEEKKCLHDTAIVKTEERVDHDEDDDVVDPRDFLKS